MMDEESVYEEAVKLMASKPEYVRAFRGILKAEEEPDIYDGMLKHSPTGKAWFANQSGTSPARIGQLRRLGLVECFWESRSTKVYCLSHPDQIRRALLPYDHKDDLAATIQKEYPEIDVEDLFKWVVGYERIKKWLRRLTDKHRRPFHIGLNGPPGSGKTAFMIDLKRLPYVRYATGTYMSKVGLYEILTQEKPFILLIDEFDKLKPEDYNTLDTLMSDAFVQRDQHDVHTRMELDTRVVTASNSWGPIPEHVRSRLKKWDFERYTPEEYLVISESVLVNVEEVSKELSVYIAEITGQFTVDIREAIRYGRMCDDTEDVDELYETDMEYEYKDPSKPIKRTIADFGK